MASFSSLFKWGYTTWNNEVAAILPGNWADSDKEITIGYKVVLMC